MMSASPYLKIFSKFYKTLHLDRFSIFMPRSPLIICLLGYDNNTCYLPEQACPNFRFCQNMAAGWPLPFYWDDKHSALVVSFSQASRRQIWMQAVDNGTLCGSAVDYYEYSNGEFSSMIKSIWEQEGWMPAITNRKYPFHLDPDYDPIPF